MFIRSLVVVAALTACATDELTTETTEQESNVVPWKQPAKWPYSVSSPRMIVHYEATGDLATAQGVLADVEHAWTEQITNSGGRAPIDNVGPDGRFDVWLQRGLDSLYVASTAANPATSYNDAFTSMVLDPWGQYGGAEMPANVFHEFRHGSQGTDDWYEIPQSFEADATLWETAYYGYDRLPYVWVDYQAHPDWNPFRNDGYKTWFMYGGALFLLYVRQHVFAGSLAWSNDVWLGCRNAPSTNEPDFVDALNAVLAPRGTNTFNELVSFNRARWYTGPNANGTIEAGDILPAVASTSHVRASGATHTSYVAGPQMLGTIYTVIQKASTDNATIKVSLSAIGNNASPVVQLVGQGAADRVLDFSTGTATIPFANNKAVLAVTMLPANGQFDPDSVATTAVKATINLDK